MKVNVEGLELPVKSLTNFELEDAVKELKISGFRGVCLRNTLPKNANENECGIMNFVRSDGPRSGHWVAWIKRGDTKIYFDSYGLQPPEEMVKYLRKPLYYNTDQVQFNGVHCGHLCLLVLKKTNTANEHNLPVKFQSVINELL